jgi:hypothetical protein
LVGEVLRAGAEVESVALKFELFVNIFYVQKILPPPRITSAYDASIELAAPM